MPPCAPTATLVSSALLVATGCGGSEAERATSTVRDYLRLQAEGDAAGACALLTASGRRQLTSFIEEQARSAVRPTEEMTCEEAIGLVRLVAGTELLNAMRDAEVGEARVTGSRADADVVGTGAVGRRRVRLEKVGAEWRIRAVPGLGG